MFSQGKTVLRLCQIGEQKDFGSEENMEPLPTTVLCAGKKIGGKSREIRIKRNHTEGQG